MGLLPGQCCAYTYPSSAGIWSLKQRYRQLQNLVASELCLADLVYSPLAYISLTFIRFGPGLGYGIKRGY